MHTRCWIFPSVLKCTGTCRDAFTWRLVWCEWLKIMSSNFACALGSSNYSSKPWHPFNVYYSFMEKKKSQNFVNSCMSHFIVDNKHTSTEINRIKRDVVSSKNFIPLASKMMDKWERASRFSEEWCLPPAWQRGLGQDGYKSLLFVARYLMWNYHCLWLDIWCHITIVYGMELNYGNLWWRKQYCAKNWGWG